MGQEKKNILAERTVCGKQGTAGATSSGVLGFTAVAHSSGSLEGDGEDGEAGR